MLSRKKALKVAKKECFDVAVIGGGATGAAAALDAATRGYSVVLIEKGDYTIGTSSRSSKLIHGGLRYLKNLDVAVVRESLLERQLMVKLAPHLVKPLPMVVAAFDGEHPDRLVGVGLNAYDLMSIDRLRRGREDEELTEWSPDRHRTVDGESVMRSVPALVKRQPTSGYLFYDCQTDDTRLVLTAVKEADRFGAICMNRVAVKSDILDQNGRICGLKVQDLKSGNDFTVRANYVINATGIWADKVIDGALVSEERADHIRPSVGTHILFKYEDLPVNDGVIVPVEDGRSIFVLPWLGRTLVGTTDNDYSGDIDHVAPQSNDIDYLLKAVNDYFHTDLNRSKLCGAFAGLRPLISNGGESNSTDVSRRAELYQAQNGMITITGGKLTTWRRMGKQAVDQIVKDEARAVPCRTEQIPLGLAIEPSELELASNLSPEICEHLAARYGYDAFEILELIKRRAELGQRIISDMPDIYAEVVYACQQEQAQHIDDILLRRTRLGLLAARELQERGGAVIAAVAELMSEQLDWSREDVNREIESFYQTALAEGVLLELKQHGQGQTTGQLDQ